MSAGPYTESNCKWFRNYSGPESGARVLSFFFTTKGVAMRRLKILVGFTLLALAAMSSPIANRNQTSAAEFTCKTSQCPNYSKCDGDHWIRSTCSITCYRDSGTPGEIIFSGSANCGTGDGGFSTGDGPPSN